jgi:putative resolvase
MNRPNLCDARVSSHDQQEDLVRQVPQLIERICSGSVSRRVLTNPDRWLRFGSELTLSLCESFHSEVVILHPGEQPLSIEEELAQDGLEIIPVFSAHLYGSRSHKNRPWMETLQAVAEQ